MQISVYQIVQLVIIFGILIYLFYYVYTILFDKNYQPKAWQNAVKTGLIKEDLKKWEKKYPDKVRFFNFWFQVERIKNENISGSFAELGVYKGDSALMIHLMDDSRTFHLFDTFTGFSRHDLDGETGKAATYSTKNFADTSVEKVRKKLSAPNFVFHAGYFPETTSEMENEKFAFVNIDSDLYNPTKAGLDFFYPRLVPGGVIIIHDYNPDWPGIMKAVNDFAKSIPVPIVPLADQDNSVMIFKGK
jgi:O-methyltransferase